MERSNKRKLPLINYDENNADPESDFDSSDSSSDDEISSNSSDESEVDDSDNDNLWKCAPQTFSPRMNIPKYKEPDTSIDENLSMEQIFLKLFPRSLFIWIADCTNERLEILSETKKRKVKLTDSNEIMVVIGCLLVMSYNRVPHLWMYWSEDKSVRNETIASAISRDRFMLLHSKLYFNHPKQPKDAGKTYYMTEMVNCLLDTFNRYRTEATFQSIDEFMVKFEGRTSMKQYQPIKPVQVGVKGYARADAISGYMYDLYIYSGKNKQKPVPVGGNSGEQVVTTLCKTIREQDVGIIIDRFFTSVNLMKNLNYACVGTVMSTRKYLPDMAGKLSRGQAMVQCSIDGIICYKWQDVKEVMLLSNCHKHMIGTADRRQKDGVLKSFDCPEAIIFYNKFMAGVDRSDQYSTCYEIDRKSNKWWKRVFYRLLMIAVSNSWILFKQCRSKKISLINYLMPVSKKIIEIGKRGNQNISKIRADTGPAHKRIKLMNEVISHQPLKRETMRRCTHCSMKKKQSRTLYICSTCDIPLCVDCFAPFHGLV